MACILSPPISDLPFRFKNSRSGQNLKTRSVGTVTDTSETSGSGSTYGYFHQSRRSRRLRSRVAESSTDTANCFFIRKDGKGSALGDGDTPNAADPAYVSIFTESNDLPLRRIVTFSKAEPLLFPVTESSTLDLFKTAEASG